MYDISEKNNVSPAEIQRTGDEVLSMFAPMSVQVIALGREPSSPPRRYLWAGIFKAPRNILTMSLGRKYIDLRIKHMKNCLFLFGTIISASFGCFFERTVGRSFFERLPMQ